MMTFETLKQDLTPRTMKVLYLFVVKLYHIFSNYLIIKNRGQIICIFGKCTNQLIDRLISRNDTYLLHETPLNSIRLWYNT
jgi:hypothetical protein